MRPLIFLPLLLAACNAEETKTALPLSTLDTPTIKTDTVPLKPATIDSVQPKIKQAKKDSLIPKPGSGLGHGHGHGHGQGQGQGQGAPGAGPRSAFTAASLSQILNRMEGQLSNLQLTGNSDHDYLAQMMVLNYRATRSLAKRIMIDESADVSEDVNKQQQMFNKAASLIRTVNPGGDTERFPLTLKAEESKPIAAIYSEMTTLSKKMLLTSDNASVVSFAEKVIQTAK